MANDDADRAGGWSPNGGVSPFLSPRIGAVDASAARLSIAVARESTGALRAGRTPRRVAFRSSDDGVRPAIESNQRPDRVVQLALPRAAQRAAMRRSVGVDRCALGIAFVCGA